MKVEKGITLIALVITIIVLLILAGVVVVTLTGENGIIGKATESQEANIVGKEIEQIKLGFKEYKIKVYTDQEAELTVESAIVVEESQSWMITFDATGNQYRLHESGEIDIINNEDTSPQNPDDVEEGTIIRFPDPEDPDAADSDIAGVFRFGVSGAENVSIEFQESNEVLEAFYEKVQMFSEEIDEYFEEEEILSDIYAILDENEDLYMTDMAGFYMGNYENEYGDATATMHFVTPYTYESKVAVLFITEDQFGENEYEILEGIGNNNNDIEFSVSRDILSRINNKEVCIAILKQQ